MNKWIRTIVFSALLASVAPGARVYAAIPIVSLENSRETSTQMVLLPSTAGGTLVIQPCVGCKSTVLRVTSDTQYFVGTSTVTLGQLTAFIHAGGPYFMMVFFKPTEPVVTRLVVSAQLLSQKTK